MGAHDEHVHASFNSTSADVLAHKISGQRHRLQAMRRDGENWYRIEKPRGLTKAETGKSKAVVYIFDEIGFFGVTALDFTQELALLDVDELDVHINSPGGEVWEGMAILNALRAHPAKVTTIVDGIAASSASFIAMGGDEVVMSRNSELMIHDAWGMAVGNAADLKDLAERLDKMSDNIASVYADRTGGTVEEWRAFMVAETWYSDAEAVEAGLADRVATSPTQDAAAKNRFDLTIFNYAGRDKAPKPRNTPQASAAEDATQEEHMGDESTPTPDEGAAPAAPETGNAGSVDAQTEITSISVPAGHSVTVSGPGAPTVPTTSTSGGAVEVSPDTTQVHTPAAPAATPAQPASAPAETVVNHTEGTGMQVDPVKLRESLGLNPSASDEEVRAAVVATGFASMTPLGEGAPTLRTQGRIPAPSAPDPTVVTVDSSILDQLRQDAAAGVEAFQKLFRQERDATITTAINEGKFAPARREHWEKAWDKDPEGTKQAIASLSKGLVPMASIGYMATNTAENREAEDVLYAELYGNGGQF